MAEEIGVAYLSVKPKMSDDFDTTVKAHGKSAGGGFGSAFAVAAGNIIANAVTNVASKAADAFTTAFSNYAQWEQLAGGVEKIFDQADISGIMQDAQNAYKELNLSANQYLESINQTGAAFAQTMGDQKGYDTARQGMKAISDYASGTGRNIDELNEKFALITRATSSYQSIADQFSGILPATSADFLAQAQAAGLLSGEYKKLTEVPIAEYQQAVSAMLEQGVKDMGLTDNTMKESTETISGSLAMLTSSWQNFTTELGKDDGDVSARTKELVDSVVAVVQNIAPRLLVFAENLFAAIPSLIDKLAPYIDEFMQRFNAFLAEHQPEIEAASAVVFDGIKAGLSLAMQAAVAALGELLQEMVSTFPEWFPQVQQAGYDLILSLISGFANGIAPFFADIEADFNQILAQIGGFLGSFFTAGGEIIENIRSGIAGGLSALKTQVDSVIKAITNPIETAKSIIKRAIDAIRDIFDSLELRLPDIALPHFDISPGAFPWGVGGQGEPPTFDVRWYGKGGFADEPTLTGYGEKGLEMYWPSYSPYFEKYARGIAEHMPSSGVDIHDCTFNVREEADIRRVAEQLNTLINRQTAGAFA